MRYASERVKRYWGFAYRRNIGVSMVAFALALAIGTAFSNLVGSTTGGIVAEFIFWGMLIVVATLVLSASFIAAHISSVSLMNEREHAAHSRYTGAWMAILVVGAIAFFIPMLFFNSSLALIVFLFSFGGMLWVLYLSVFAIFRHTYHEIAIAAVTLWIAFIATFASATSVVPGTPISAYALFVSTVVVITVSGVTGMAMLFNASREFAKDFVLARGAAGAARRTRPRRRSNR